jgi:hypothetical protein
VVSRCRTPTVKRVLSMLQGAVCYDRDAVCAAAKRDHKIAGGNAPGKRLAGWFDPERVTYGRATRPESRENGGAKMTHNFFRRVSMRPLQGRLSVSGFPGALPPAIRLCPYRAPHLQSASKLAPNKAGASSRTP